MLIAFNSVLLASLYFCSFKKHKPSVFNVLAFLLGTLLVFLIWASITANAEGKNNTIKIAIMPTFGAHQHIGYEVIDRMKAQGINVETVIIKSSTQGNGLLMNKQIQKK